MSPFKVKGKVTKAIESWNERKREEQNIRFLILTPTLLSQSNLLLMVPSLFSRLQLSRPTNFKEIQYQEVSEAAKN